MTAEQLQQLLQLKNVKPTLTRLTQQNRLTREKISGRVVYFAYDLIVEVGLARLRDQDERADQQTVLGYLEKYQQQLVGHGIPLPGREKPLVVARTNNLAEHRFSSFAGHDRETLAPRPYRPCGPPSAGNGPPHAHHQKPDPPSAAS